MIRQQYEKALRLARKQRKQHFRNLQKKERPSGLHVISENKPVGENIIEIPGSPVLTMRESIAFLQNINMSEADYEILQRELGDRNKIRELEKPVLQIDDNKNPKK